MTVWGAVQKIYVGENHADGHNEILKPLSIKIGFNIIHLIKQSDFHYTWCAHGLFYLSPEFRITTN